PDTLFQCMWNRCWWYDAPGVDAWFVSRRTDMVLAQPLYAVMEAWREDRAPRPWLRALRPPTEPLGSGLVAQYPRATPIPDDDPLLQHAATVLSSNTPSYTTTSPDGTIQVKRSDKGSYLMDAQTDTLLHELIYEGPDDIGCATDYLFSPTGRWLVVLGWIDDYCGRVDVWALDMTADGRWTGAQPRRVARYEDGYQYKSASFSQDEGTFVLTAPSQIILIDTDTWKVKRRWRHRAHHAVVLSHQPLQLACQEAGWLRIWNVDHAEQPHAVPHTDVTGAPTFTPQGSRLFTLPWLWDGRTGEPVAKLNIRRGGWLEGGPPANALFISDRRVVLAEGGLSAWDARSGQPESIPALEPRHFFTLRDHIEYSSPDGAQMAMFSRGNSILTLLPVAADAPARIDITLPHGQAGQICYSPDGQMVAVGCADGAIAMVDAASGELLWNQEGHPEAESMRLPFGHYASRVTALLFSSDGTHLVSAGAQECLRVWDVSDGTCLGERTLEPFTQTHVLTRTSTHGDPIQVETVVWSASPEAIAALDGWCGFRVPQLRPESIWRLVQGDENGMCLQNVETHTRVRYPGPALHPCEHPDGGIWAIEGAHVVVETA
ncbi:MAG: WD40 repeat domain-containing protein, partial [Myxococcota bacterium]